MTHERTRCVVLRLLGVVYTAAFPSLAWQVLPLLGAHGITPATYEVEGMLQHAGSQLWFAAMSQIDQEPWLVALVVELLDGNQEVARLFARVPFAGRAPKYLRILRYRYRFAALSEHAFWVRDQPELYLPPVSRDDLR